MSIIPAMVATSISSRSTSSSSCTRSPKGPKLCTDCRWHTLTGYSTPHCTHPKSISKSYDVVNGDTLERLPGCTHNRKDQGWWAPLFFGTCGRRARWWEAKP